MTNSINILCGAFILLNLFEFILDIIANVYLNNNVLKDDYAIFYDYRQWMISASIFDIFISTSTLVIFCILII